MRCPIDESLRHAWGPEQFAISEKPRTHARRLVHIVRQWLFGPFRANRHRSERHFSAAFRYPAIRRKRRRGSPLANPVFAARARLTLFASQRYGICSGLSGNVAGSNSAPLVNFLFALINYNKSY